MIKKISNWVFGSFFRTIGRLLVYILLGYLLSILLSKYDISGLFNILEVHAVQTDSWLINVKNRPTYTLGYNWTSANNYSTLSLSQQDLSEYNSNLNEYDLNVYYNHMIGTDTSITLGSNGVSFVNFVGQVMRENYLYSITNYYCTYSSGRPDVKYASASSTAVDSLTNHSNYNISFVASVNVPYGMDFYNCYAISTIIAPSKTGGWLNQRLTGSGSGTWYLFGFDISELGIYNAVTKSDIESAINNSGLATASSVSAVQSSVNQVKTEIQATQDAINDQTQQQQQNHQETIDTITSDNINENGVSNFTNGLNKEYSSLTPFSDFLNLPLNWIRSLLASSNTCTPINLPLPYLNNKTLILPCMTEFWERMGSLGTFVQMVWIAIVGVRIFNGLYLLTCDVLDPNPDKDMIRLKTWEL